MSSLEKSEKSLRYIIPIVLFFHLAALILAISQTSTPHVKEETKKLVVATVMLEPKQLPKVQKELIVEAPKEPKIEKQIPEPIVELSLPPEKEEPIAYSYTPDSSPSTPSPSPKQQPLKEKPLPEKQAPKPKPLPKKDPPKKTPPKTLEKKTPPVKKVEPKKVIPEKKAPPKENKKNENKPSSQVTQKETPKQTLSPDPKEVALKAKKNELLLSAKEKISKINLSSDTMVGKSKQLELTTATPSRIESLTSDTLSIDTDATLSVKESAYKDELRSRLKLMLKLPQYGDVKIKLTINRQGKVSDLKVISAANQMNKEYIEKNLKKMNLPPFGSNFPGEESYTFTITISNES